MGMGRLSHPSGLLCLLSFLVNLEDCHPVGGMELQKWVKPGWEQDRAEF